MSLCPSPLSLTHVLRLPYAILPPSPGMYTGHDYTMCIMVYSAVRSMVCGRQFRFGSILYRTEPTNRAEVELTAKSHRSDRSVYGNQLETWYYFDIPYPPSL